MPALSSNAKKRLRIKYSIESMIVFCFELDLLILNVHLIDLFFKCSTFLIYRFVRSVQVFISYKFNTHIVATVLYALLSGGVTSKATQS